MRAEGGLTNVPRQNPLVRAPEPEAAEVPEIFDDLLGDAVGYEGPQEPLYTVPTGKEPWPRVHVGEHKLITVAGLHGGAGASTVAQLFGDVAVDAGQGWPVASGWKRPLPTLGVIAVARAHYVGLAAADEFTRQWAARELTESRLLGLVIVDDAPRLLDAQIQEVKRLLKLTPYGAHLPWNEEWRVGPPGQALPRRLKKIVRRYMSLAEQETE